MNARHVTEATLRARDQIYAGLLVRRGEVLTEELARERANNISTAVVEALVQLAEESRRPVGAGETGETMEEHCHRMLKRSDK